MKCLDFLKTCSFLFLTSLTLSYPCKVIICFLNCRRWTTGGSQKLSRYSGTPAAPGWCCSVKKQIWEARAVSRKWLLPVLNPAGCNPCRGKEGLSSLIPSSFWWILYHRGVPNAVAFGKHGKVPEGKSILDKLKVSGILSKYFAFLTKYF